jgi:cobalt/nickel transport system permease protein
VLIPGEPLVGALGMTVTLEGVTYVGLFTLRVAAGVSLLSVLVLTTPFATIVGAMRRLRVPVALVWVIAVTYRYLFLFFDELRRLVLARNSRTTGEDSLRGEWRDARRLSGTFLLRALDRGERVGRGMRARGGGREPTPYERPSSLDAGDCVLAASAVLVVAVAVVVRWGG